MQHRQEGVLMSNYYCTIELDLPYDTEKHHAGTEVQGRIQNSRRGARKRKKTKFRKLMIFMT